MSAPYSSQRPDKKEQLKRQMAERVDAYASRFNEFRRHDYNETEVRIDFVNPFFKALGWDVDNEVGRPQHLREVTHEATVLVEEDGKKRSKKPDYSFRVGTETLFFLETKKPSVDINVDNAPAFQLRRYGWSGNLKISVLTNFSDLYIYDCSIRPVEGDGVGMALIAHYHFTEYVEKFNEIYALLSKETVLSGAFATAFENITGSFRREPFDEYFLKQITEWRKALGADIAAHNPSIKDSTLNISVQRIMNRIIFLRICEDRSFENYELLKNIRTYAELKNLFIAADKKYDSGLFELLEEDRLNVSDDVLIDIFRNLYYPNSSYEFSVVDPFIIGQIYELFLAEQLEMLPNREVSIVQKPEAVDSQGAVNTPKSITDIIVEQTLNPLFARRPLAQVENLCIADICCGSGNFLLSTFEYIVNYYIWYYLQTDKDAALREGYIIQLPGTDEYRLSFALRRKILTTNIWGVDIDPLAVEVAKFSLFLKLLEDSSAAEMDAFSAETSLRILPRLDDNIKNGNSLVDTSFAKYAPHIYEDIALMEKIRMFDWAKEFGGTGFDAIVGNPPYIRVQNMVRYSPEEYGFYRSSVSSYETADTELLDKYYLFVERAWTLLRDGGRIGYIVPHKFMNIASGKPLRKYLAEKKSVERIIHFGTYQIFRNRSTYTCILILSKQAKESFLISFIQDWNQYLATHQTRYDAYALDHLSPKPWTFIPVEITERLRKLGSKCDRLDTITDIFVGVQSSNDKIYIISPECEDDTYVYFTDKAGDARKIEKGILRKSIYDAQIKKYHPILPNTYIIFPYRNVNGKAELISLSTMQKDYPYALEYLSAFRTELDKRSMPGRTLTNWYGYGRKQSLNKFVQGEHLIMPVLSLDSNYVYDNEQVVFTGGGNGPFYGIQMRDSVHESIFYIQAILNHWLMELIVRKTGSTFRGGYYSHGKQFIQSLPIYRIDFHNREERKLHDEIVAKVHLIERLTRQTDEAENSVAKTIMQRSVDHATTELNALIDDIYGATEKWAENTDESSQQLQ